MSKHLNQIRADERHRQKLKLGDVKRLMNHEHITIPEWANYIENDLFNKMLRLKHIYVDAANVSYVSIDGVLHDGEISTLIKFPQQKKLDKYCIAESVIEIDSSAFFGCTKLDSIHIPKSVFDINWNFCSYSSVKCITVDPNNSYYTSLDGVLFNKNKTVLIAYPPGIDADTYEIPEGVVRVLHRAFQGACNLVEIKIPDSVESFSASAIEKCSKLTRINLPPKELRNKNGRVLWYERQNKQPRICRLHYYVSFCKDKNAHAKEIRKKYHAASKAMDEYCAQTIKNKKGCKNDDIKN